ncbi:MAG: nicotinate (nicotinamide) nucleotide adenylyltransferase [Armatimonadetes bacterium]|nr:nicotinate (nicotinamide) nucleotide adenylyltransferase [Armatimonadota bacterium]
MKIGILGGSFNPPHLGHMAVAKAAKAELGLDAVLWVPANRNPLKAEVEGTPSANKRLKMVEKAVSDEPGMMVSDLEITRGGPSYTVDTIEELQKGMPGASFWLILGGDSLNGFFGWHYPDRILRMCRLAVTVRPGTDIEEIMETNTSRLAHKLDLFEMEPNEISSTKIRDLIRRGGDITDLVHPLVAEYILQNGLYKQS